MALAEPKPANNIKKIVVAVVALVVGAGVLYWGYRRANPSLGGTHLRPVWYYDLENKQLISGPMRPIPVMTTRSGAVLVLAHVYSCGKCDSGDDADQWIGYLERVPPELAKQWDDAFQDGAAKPDLAQMAHLKGELFQETRVAAPDATTPEQWVLPGSPEGMALKSAPLDKCNGGPAGECVYAAK